MVIGEYDTAPDFTFGPRHSRRHLAKVHSDTDFADDIALLSNTINQAMGYCTYLYQHAIQLPPISTHPKTKYVAIVPNMIKFEQDLFCYYPLIFQLLLPKILSTRIWHDVTAVGIHTSATASAPSLLSRLYPSIATEL